MLQFNAGTVSLIDRYTDIPWCGKFANEVTTPSIKTRPLCLRSEVRHRILLTKFDRLSDELWPSVDKQLVTVGYSWYLDGL